MPPQQILMSKFTQNSNFRNYLIFLGSLLLFASSFIFKYFSIDNASFKNRVETLQNNLHKQEKDAGLIAFNTALINKLVDASESTKNLENIYQKPYGFYAYIKTGNARYLAFWNTALVIVPDSIINNGKQEQFVLLPNGYYFIKKLNYPSNSNIELYCTFLIKSEFFITTNYFKESFPLNKTLDNSADISEEATQYVVQSQSKKAQIFLKKLNHADANSDSVATVAIRLISLFLIFISLYFILYKKFVKKYRLDDVLLFLSCMMAFRLILYFGRHALKLGSLYLFDPSVYATNSFLPSLGDLLINSLLFCWFGIFIWNRVNPATGSKPIVIPEKYKWWMGAGGVIALLVLTINIVTVIKSIIADSKISFDVTNFFSLSIYTVVGFVILAFLSLGFYYFSRLLYYLLFPAFKKDSYYIYLLLAVIGLLYVAFVANKNGTGIYLLCIVWLLLYTLIFNYEEKLNILVKLNTSGIILWIFIFSLSISALMLSEINKAELNQRKLYIQKLDTQSDPSTERLMAIANTYLDTDFFLQNFSRLYDSTQNKYLRDSILSNNYFRYVRNYAGQLYIFDSLNKPLFNANNASYESLNTITFKQAKPTELPDLYFYESDYDNFAYITYREIKDNSNKFIGSVYIVSKPKQFSDVSMSPELFRQYRDWEFSNSTVYNYAIYANKLLVASSKKYPFTSTLVASQIPRLRYELRENTGYSELWYKPSSNKVIVMTRKKEGALQAITLFSYLFCAFLFLVALIQLGSNLISFVLNKRAFIKRRLRFPGGIRSQIHNTFILITVLSFVVIGVATISFFTKRFENSNTERLGRTMDIMLNEMQSHRELSSLIFEQRSKKDSINSNQLEDIIKRVADIHGLDANIYDYTGRLLATSQPDVYEKGVLSMQIDPKAFYYLFKLRHIEHTQKETVSDLMYTSIYAPMRNSDGSFFAYMSIPYFTSQQELNQEISRFLVTLINLNAFIFLITGLVAILVTNYITRSFSLIKEKLMLVNLSKDNEKIVWEKNDEIGGLVAEYNKMVSKLKISAEALAKSERQEAWREMARQVAHEIKNPLTPMKLSLQYLQKAIAENSPSVQTLTARVSETIVEQIDHLSKIAADFSQFANINQINKEIFDLHHTISSLLTIFSKNENVNVQWTPIKTSAMIFADRTQINRVFANLLTNAVEAAPNDKKCQIKIIERKVDNRIAIEIHDNGQGISDDMKEKIFTPNFTTKSSGTGLGLAMCKSIIEQTGGSIHFTTMPGAGACFIVELVMA